MNPLFDRIRNSHEFIFKFFIAVCAIAALAYVFPKEGKFKYEFQKGKPWLHEKLYAPFDFAINKSEEQLQQERSTAKAKVKPYFARQNEVHKGAVNDFLSGFDELWQSDPYGEGAKKFGLFGSRDTSGMHKTLRTLGVNVLSEIYDTGIMQLHDRTSDQPDDFLIVIQEGNRAKEVEIGQLYTVKSATLRLESLVNGKDSLRMEWLLPVLQRQIRPNLTYDPAKSAKAIENAEALIARARGKVNKGETVIDQGDVVNDDAFLKLSSLKEVYEQQLGGENTSTIILLGQTLLITILVGLMLAFLYLFRKRIYLQNDKVLFLLLLVTLDVYMANISIAVEAVHLYMLPFCIVPIVIRTFYDARLATFTHLISITIIGFIAPNGYEFMFIQIIAGLVAVYSLVSLRKRSQLFTTSAQIFIAYTLTFLGLAAIHEGDLSTIEYGHITRFLIGAGLTLFAYPLIYVFEKTFGFLSDVSLMELSDTNGKLLRQLAEKAPGTFQHSLQVANLAEDAIREIGGNAMMVRTGALYHDIGKMDAPLFFIENQTGNNPHDDLSPKESARIIIGHVLKGVEMGKKHGLPEQILDFIRTHHGTTKTMYFLINYKKQHPEIELDERDFQYPGPLPFSKETAVLMMADSVEAASRSLKTPNEQSISELVEKIIDGQASQRQFENADITYKDITTIKKIFKQKLVNIYHARIEYPKG